jgi:integrase
MERYKVSRQTQSSPWLRSAASAQADSQVALRKAQTACGCRVEPNCSHLRVPVKIAQEQLGHASISTTLNIYTHVVDGRTVRRLKRWNVNCSQVRRAAEQAVPVTDRVN